MPGIVVFDAPSEARLPLTSQPSALRRTRRWTDRFVHHPLTELAIVLLIVVGVAALLAESAFPAGSPARQALVVMGDTITWFFIIELSARLWVAPRKLRFFTRYWLDILAVLPIARPLRLLRVLLLLRLFRAGVLLNRRMRQFGGLLRGTLGELSIIAALCLMIILVAALLIHTTGGTVQLDQPGLAGALWFSVFTLIGGEPIGGQPTTEVGRLLTLGLMVGGLTIFGVFVGAVSASMVTVLAKRLEVRDMELDDLKEHIIGCGWNPAGRAMLHELFGGGDRPTAVVIVTEVDRPPEVLSDLGLPGELIYHHKGDYTRVEVLREAGIERASAAILLTDTCVDRADADRDARTVLAALSVERLNPGIFCCAELVNEEHASLLEMAEVEEVVVRDWYAGVLIGSMGRNLGLAAVLNDILTASRGNAFRKVRVTRRVAGKSIGELHQLLKTKHNAILVSWERPLPRTVDHPTRRVDAKVNPPADLKVSRGDVLVVISEDSFKL